MTGIPVIQPQRHRVNGVSKPVLNMSSYVDDQYEVTGKLGMVFTIRKLPGTIHEG